MRRLGRMEPGSGGGVLTGQRVSFIPARIAATRARLSFLLRLGTVGTVIAAVGRGMVPLITADALRAAAVPIVSVTDTGSSVGTGDCSSGRDVLPSFATQLPAPIRTTARPSAAAEYREWR